jgi:gliding motility-associated-like protein
MLKYRSIILLLCLFFNALGSNAQVVASFSASTPTVGCAPLVVNFSNSSTGATDYKWNFGTGSPVKGVTSPVFTYLTPGTYSVTLTAYNGTDSSVVTKTAYITVYDVPAVSFSASPTKGCPGTCINFTDASTLKAPGSGTYLWDFGDGNSGSSTSSNHCYPKSGYYNISLVVTNSRGCTSTLVKDSFIYIYPAPRASFTGNPLRFCTPVGRTTFTNGSGSGTPPLHYKWRFGDGGTSSIASPSHDYTTTGSFDVTLVVTDTNGCMDSVTSAGDVTIKSPKASFTGPSNGCTGSAYTFTNTTTDPGSAKWFYGDGSSSTNTDGYHTWSVAGTYTVSLVINDGTCQDTFKSRITISDGPPDSFSFSPKEPCPAPQTINFTFKGSGASRYSWSFGDGGTSTAANPPHTYLNNGVYSVTLTATGPTGCVSTVSDSIFIRDMQAAIIPYPSDKGCVPFTINFSEGVETTIPGPAIYPYAISSLQWEWGDGTPNGSGFSPSHTFTDTGTFIVKLTVTHNPGGCTAIAYDTVHVGDHPNIGFHPTKDTVCKDPALHFINTSTHANEFIWDFGDNSGYVFDVNPTHGYGDTGSYRVRLIAKYNGCPDTIFHQVYVLPPVAAITLTAPCPKPGDTLKLYDTSSILLTSHTWYFGNGDSSFLNNPRYVYNTLGSHTITLVGNNSSTGCSDTANLSLLYLLPKDSIWAVTDTDICMNGKITFRDSVLGSPFSSSFSFFDRPFDSTRTVQIPSTGLPVITDSFTAPGYHYVIGSALAANSCAYSDTQIIIVGYPRAGFKATPLIACVPSTVTFTDTSHDVPGTSITKRLWTFGDGDTLTTRSSTAYETYKYKGKDSVKLIVTDNIGCKDSLTRLRYISVIKPVANFYASNTAPCIGTPVFFYNYSAADTSVTDTLSAYYWSFGDGDTSMAQGPSHIYTDTGTFTVRLVVKDSRGCSDTMTRTKFISINAPHASFTMDDSTAICPPLHVQFTNTSTGATSYVWDMGDSNSYTIANPGHTFTKSKYYTVKLIVTNASGCQDSVAEHVNIYGYDGALTYGPLAGCSPLTVTFKASITNAPISVWDFNDGYAESDSTGISTATHTYNHPGAYVPKLVLSDGKGCKSGSSGLDTIKVDGVIARYNPHVPCVGDTVTFVDSSYSYFSPVTGWYWVLSGGLTSTANYAVNRYLSAGEYPVMLAVVNGSGCKDTLNDSVIIYPPPVIDAGPDTSICPGDAATLMPSGGVTYLWFSDPTLSCTSCTHPKASPSVRTVYTVMGIDVHGCKNTDTVAVSLHNKTIAVFAPPADICQGDTAHLHVAGGQIYAWSPADSLSNPYIADPLAYPRTTTTYTVIAKEGSCIPDTASATLVVHPKPVISAGNDVTIVGGTSTTLQASGSNIVSFLWDSTQTLSCLACSNPVASPAVTTTYVVVGTSDYGCKDTADVTVNVKCDKSQVFIPNAFTPNGDGQNDVFYPRGVSISTIKSFRVYNRWGEVIFEKTGININDENSGWDGSYGGTPQPPAVYVYIIDAICESGQEMVLKGDVTVIR